MKKTNYKTIGSPEPPDKPRSTEAQKRMIQTVKVWIAKIKRGIRR